uniref:CUB domain-containing protein n=1 Tax=Panagrellus redivivus TaxID=6233 RepID=A0A7E4VBJ1_PANRE
MYSRFVLLVICSAVGIVQGKVKLTKGRNETITFKGNELTIDVDNSMGANYDLIICFGSSPEASYQPCPLGYARFLLTFGANEKMQLIVNRRSQIFKGSAVLSPLGAIKFNDDGTLNIMVVELPDAKTTVTLTNAEIFVPEKQVDAIVQKKKSNVGTVEILAILIVLIVICVIVGILFFSKESKTIYQNHLVGYPTPLIQPLSPALTMYSRLVLLILCLAVGIVQGEVKLTKGSNETVSFTGEELTIEVDNTLGANAELIICFGSSPDASHPPCPLGYARFSLGIGGNRKVRFIINRQGQFVGGYYSTLGNVKFNDDGTLNIMVLQLPDAKTVVTLPNADIFVPEKQVDAIVKKKRSNAGTVGIIAIIIVLIVIGVIVGILVWCCITCTSKPKQTPEFNRQDDSPHPQQFRRQTQSTYRKSSSIKPAKRASNTTSSKPKTSHTFKSYDK